MAHERSGYVGPRVGGAANALDAAGAACRDGQPHRSGLTGWAEPLRVLAGLHGAGGRYPGADRDLRRCDRRWDERITLEPLIDRSHDELERAGVGDRVEVALADAGFWNTEQIERLGAGGIRPLVKPDAGHRKSPGKTRQQKSHYVKMREQLATEEGKGLYRQRQAIIEPVFAQTKHNHRVDRFQRRGLGACRAEWRLITATHNLLKLWRHGPAPVPG